MSEQSTLLDTLDMSPRDRNRLLESMNHMAAQPIDAPCRRRLRVDFGNAPALVLKLIEEDGRDMRYTVQPRNISRWGVSVIHGRFLYPDTICLVAIPSLERKYTLHQAVVRQCRHVKGTVHEASLVFAAPIALGEYVELTEEQAVIVEHEEAQDNKAAQRES